MPFLTSSCPDKVTFTILALNRGFHATLHNFQCRSAAGLSLFPAPAHICSDAHAAPKLAQLQTINIVTPMRRSYSTSTSI